MEMICLFIQSFHCWRLILNWCFDFLYLIFFSSDYFLLLFVVVVVLVSIIPINTSNICVCIILKLVAPITVHTCISIQNSSHFSYIWLIKLRSLCTIWKKLFLTYIFKETWNFGKIERKKGKECTKVN